MTILWVLNQADGNASLLDIAIRANLSLRDLQRAAIALQSADLIGL